MFTAVSVGNRLEQAQFDELELPLRQQLMAAQLDLAGRPYSVVLVVAGLEGAGKGSLAHRLTNWLDPRHVETNAFWLHSDEEESRPYFWRFWRRLPAHGKVGIFIGAWYTQLLTGVMDKRLDRHQVKIRLDEINAFERLLADAGTLVIKLWLHVSRDAQRLQLRHEAPRNQQNPGVGADPEYWWHRYEEAVAVAEGIISATNSGVSRWQLIEADDRPYREITAGGLLLQALQTRAAQALPAKDDELAQPPAPAFAPEDPVLASVDLSTRLGRKKYRKKLAKYQHRLDQLAWRAFRQRRSLVAVFEGWDAAGKGSAIRRVTAAMDPRLYNVLQYAAPTEEERVHHYLWRFWRGLERDGLSTLFDRSWYGRVLVERVEQFASPKQWQRGYAEINEFEQQLVDHGGIVVKFWLHISPEEQLRRFEARELQPHKRHKITADDWRNRDQWTAYQRAVADMVNQTSTVHAPWTLVAGNDKRYARIQILKTLCRQLAAHLDNSLY